MQTCLKQPSLVSEIEARYALTPMGRDREFVRLLDVDLMALVERLDDLLGPPHVSMTHQVLRLEREYVLRMQLTRGHQISTFDLYLNTQGAFFVLRFEGINQALFSSKGIVQTISKAYGEQQASTKRHGMRLDWPPTQAHNRMTATR